MFCRFVIGREKPGEQSEVAQLIQQTLEQERWQREMMEQRYKQYMDDDEEVHTPSHCSSFDFWNITKYGEQTHTPKTQSNLCDNDTKN